MKPDDIHIEDLKDGFAVYTSNNYKFSTDSIMLAHYCFNKAVKTVCEFGAGCGIISILLAKLGVSKIYSIEIQKEAAGLLKRGINHSGLDEVVTPVLGDFKEFKVDDGNKVDAVVCNPPYVKLNDGIVCKSAFKSIARHEVCSTVYDVCATASDVLKDKGVLFMSQRPKRLIETFDALNSAGLRKINLKFCAHDKDTVPFVVLIGAKRAQNLSLEVEPVWLIYGDNLKFTSQMRKMYIDFGWEGKIE